MPTNRKEYMRQYMADKRAAAKARGTSEKTSPHEPVKAQPAPQVEVAPLAAEFAAGKSWVAAERAAKPRPSFLAAPDDDCMTCKHDRQTTHPEGGKCGHGCLCRRFRPAGTDLVPCHLCGHDEFHGHAATPCDQWMEPGYCGCPSFIDPSDLF